MSSLPSKFAKPPQAPVVWTHTAESIHQEAQDLIRNSRELLDRIVAKYKPEDATWENSYQPQIELQNEWNARYGTLYFYYAVSADKELREASSQADELMQKASTEQDMRQDGFNVLKAVYERRDTFNLEPEQLRILEKDHRYYIRNGLGLPEHSPERARFKALADNLTELQIQFQKTLNDEDGGLWFTPAELDGLPAEILGRLAKGDGENEGKVRLTYKYPDLIPALKYVRDGDVRLKIFIGNNNKCNSNVPLLKQMVLYRDEAARLVGYPDHATMLIEGMMAKTPSFVNEFLLDLRTRLRPLGEKDAAQLARVKNADLAQRGMPEAKELFIWDSRYCERIFKENEYQFDEALTAEYFPLGSTLAGLLGIYEKLLGLRFFTLTEADKAALSPTGKAADVTWHKDAIMLAVWDDESEGDGFNGYMYLDLHPRPGKYTHAALFTIAPGFLKTDGTRSYPSAALVCNFSPPNETQPSLLKHDELVVLFHELGHAIHCLVSRTKYSRFHGTSTVRDFVEAPSQMLENWCWTADVLKELSGHWKTGEKMPDGLVTSVLRTYRVFDGLSNLRQVQLGTFDMAIHQPASHDDAAKMDPTGLYNRLTAELVPLKGPEYLGMGSHWGHGPAIFGHLAGGYDARYYGYMSSLVYAADMFHTAFKKDPMDGKVGRRYRHVVLERGGSRDEMENLVEFLGRKPSTEAFYQDMGLEKA